MFPDDEWWDEYVEAPSFIGECACDHPNAEPGRHDYAGCTHDGCECKAHLED